MKLSSLLEGVSVKKVLGEDKIIDGVKTNSNCVKQGDAYLLLSENAEESTYFIKDAIKKGASAIVLENMEKVEYVLDVTFVIVEDIRKCFTKMCSNLYGNPEKDLKIIGITGTNGKTTVGFMIKHILEKNGVKCALIGTNGIYFDDIYVKPKLTTPDPNDLFYYFRQIVDKNISIVVMEVSAHSIFFDKIYGIDFFCGVFTNLSQDHLDFFKSMDEYRKTKLNFLNNENCKYIVANADDTVIKEIKDNNNKVLTYGIKEPSDVFAINIQTLENGEKFVLNIFDKIYEVFLPILGDFNVYNSLAAFTVLSILGIKMDNIISSIKDFKGVEGRMEQVYNKDFKIYIDYAHTPDGLKQALISLKKITENNLIVVFGCGGNRDKEKRPIMGEIATTYADFTVITTDNPRFENKFDIVLDIEKGVVKDKKRIVVLDRIDAIRYAINSARKNDTLLIAGKGAEDYQDIMGVKHDYNDKETVMKILGEKGID